MALENLNELKEDELRAVGEFFGVELPSEDSDELPKTAKARQKALAKLLEEDESPVTVEDYNTAYLPNKPKTEEDLAEEAKAKEDAEVAKAAERDVLLRMSNKRGSYVMGGVKFTRQHPFSLVTKSEAVYLTSLGGFSYATPQEAAEYYDA